MVAVQVVLCNQEGLILGVSRKENHLDFGFIGGKMDEVDNGDPIATAIRETKEETGLDISDLRLIFAMHKDGYMCYTYLASYSGEIHTDEPHVVRWLPMESMIQGGYGRYNRLVSDSMVSYGILFQERLPLSVVTEEVKELLESLEGGYKLNVVSTFDYQYEIYLAGNNRYLYGNNDFDEKLHKLNEKLGVKIILSSNHLPQ